VPRREYVTIRLLILQALQKKPSSVNEVADSTRINWRTVDKHIKILHAKALVSALYKGTRLKVFGITPLGEQILEQPLLQEVLG